MGKYFFERVRGGVSIFLQLVAIAGELFANTAGGDFTPHVVTVHAGEVINDFLS